MKICERVSSETLVKKALFEDEDLSITYITTSARSSMLAEDERIQDVQIINP